jgi:hypothetical protein
MSRKLKAELQRLKEIGGVESLASELDAFIETLETSEHSIPLSRKLLAEAAQAIRSNALDVAHDFIGTAIEAYTQERVGGELSLPKEVSANLNAGDVPPEGTLDGVPFPELPIDPPSYEQASEEVVSGFANLLVTAGYVEEASKYLSGYKTLKATEGQGEQGMKDLDTLKKMRENFKAQANLNMVRTLDQVIAEMEEEEKPAEPTLEEPVTMEEPKADEPAAPAPVAEEPAPAPMPEGEEKPVLEIEPEGEEEKKEKEAAEAAVLKGDIKKAKQHVKKARAMERARIIAALVKVGDFELASEGLAEAEADEIPMDDVPPAEKNAGLANPFEPKGAEGEEKPEDKKEDMPTEIKDKVEQPAPACGEEEGDERKEAEEISASVKKLVKGKKMKEAVEALTKLDALEKAVAEGVRVAEQDVKDTALAAEGYQVWKGVRKSRLTAEVALAEGEGDEEAKQEAM